MAAIKLLRPGHRRQAAALSRRAARTGRSGGGRIGGNNNAIERRDCRDTPNRRLSGSARLFPSPCRSRGVLAWCGFVKLGVVELGEHALPLHELGEAALLG